MILMKGAAPAPICALLSGRYTGTVEMVNSRGIYLELSGKRILLCSSQLGSVPNGAALENWQILPSLLSQGQTLRTGEGLLRFPSCKLQLQLQSIPEDTQTSLPSRQGLEGARRLLLGREKSTGLAPLAATLFGKEPETLNLHCRVALPYLEALLAALSENVPSAITQSVQNLLGFGPGLTPSGDDVLSGLLYGLRHSPWRDRPATAALTVSIQKLAGEMTNAVSADYLRALAADAPFEKMALAWRDPEAHAAELLDIGNNSGSEMLLGLLLAGKLLGKLSSENT